VKSTKDMPEHTENGGDDALLGTKVDSVEKSIKQEDVQEPSAHSDVARESGEAEEYPDDTEDPFLISSYGNIPVLEQTKLPRGGVSVETAAVGRVQVCENVSFVLYCDVFLN
jgi:hypothetical protein